MLKNYADQNTAKELAEGFQFGFRLGYEGPRIGGETTNLKSVSDHLDETKSKIQSEVELGRISGPFDSKPITNLRVSPIGLVPKADGKWRLITHLSFPDNQGVNHFIDPDKCSVTYASLDQALELITTMGKRTQLAKMDVKSAFRLLIIHPGDFDLLGFKFEGKYYIDKCLPMGCAMSCCLFEKFATFLQWELERRTGLDTVFHYLDDFLFLGHAGSDECTRLMEGFTDLSDHIGLPLAHDKTVGPATKIVFLGLEIDTDDMVVRIPPDKVDQLKSLLNFAMVKRSLRLKEIQSLVGSLNFFSKGVPNARAFNRRFYDATSGIKKSHHHIKITEDLKQDIRMWLYFLENFNGVRLIHDKEWISNHNINLYTDSSGNSSLGCGAYCNGSWCFWQWPTDWEEETFKEMSFLELVPILLSISLWGQKLFKNKKIIMHTDNQALVSIINKQTSKSKRVMMLVRKMVLLLLENNIMFKAQHIYGKVNNIADALSRKQFQKFRTLAPNADQDPEPIPIEFQVAMLGVK